MNQNLYIDRDTSSVIKGVLIILIVMGHNKVLCSTDNKGADYLYLFHVICFFILPFFYDTKKEITVKRLCDIVVRNWIPYFWICIGCYVISSVANHEFNWDWSHVWAFVNGTQTPLLKNFGFIFPWFLPTYCSFYILYLFTNKYKHFYRLLTVLSLITWSFSWSQFHYFKGIIPFGIGLAIYYFGFGVLSFYINRLSVRMKYLGAFLFVLLSVDYWLDYSFLSYSYKLLPICFFLGLLWIAPYLNFRWLKLLGDNSLGIYMIHIFLVNVSYFIFPDNFWGGMIGLVVTLLISLWLVKWVVERKKMRSIFLPRSWSDIKMNV